MSLSVFKGDCLEVMKGIPSGTIDMVLADPPYGTTRCLWDEVIPLQDWVDFGGRKFSKDEWMLIAGVDSQNLKQAAMSFDEIKNNGVWTELKRIIKPRGVIVLTAAQPFTSVLTCSNLEMFKYDLVWEKPNATGFLNAKKMP